MKKIFAVLFATLILAFTAVPAFAAKDKNPSPSATSTYNVIVHPNKGGTGSYTTTTTSDGKYVILTAHNKDGYVFKYWIIDGKYVLIDGSLDSQKLKLKLNGDIEATPYFEPINGTSPSNTSVSQNTGNKSPQTGTDALFYAIIGFALFVTVVGAVGVKLAVSKK